MIGICKHFLRTVREMFLLMCHRELWEVKCGECINLVRRHTLFSLLIVVTPCIKYPHCPRHHAKQCTFVIPALLNNLINLNKLINNVTNSVR